MQKIAGVKMGFSVQGSVHTDILRLAVQGCVVRIIFLSRGKTASF